VIAVEAGGGWLLTPAQLSSPAVSKETKPVHGCSVRGDCGCSALLQRAAGPEDEARLAAANLRSKADANKSRLRCKADSDPYSARGLSWPPPAAPLAPLALGARLSSTRAFGPPPAVVTQAPAAAPVRRTTPPARREPVSPCPHDPQDTATLRLPFLLTRAPGRHLLARCTQPCAAP